MVTRSADELQTHHYTTGEIVMRIWREHLRPRIGLLALASVAMILTAATTGAIPFLIRTTADDVFVAKNQQMIYWVTAGIVVVTIVKAISEYVADVTVAYLGHRFIADLRIQMFAKLAGADLSFIQTVHSGRLLSGFLNDANLLRQTASRSIVTLGENYLKVIILVATMFYMDARFAFLILLFMPFAWFLLGRQRRKMRKSTTKSLQETGDLFYKTPLEKNITLKGKMGTERQKRGRFHVADVTDITLHTWPNADAYLSKQNFDHRKLLQTIERLL